MRTSRATNAQKKSGCFLGLTKNDRSSRARRRFFAAGESLGSRSRSGKSEGQRGRRTARTRKPIEARHELGAIPPRSDRRRRCPGRESREQAALATGARSGTMALIGPRSCCRTTMTGPRPRGARPPDGPAKARPGWRREAHDPARIHGTRRPNRARVRSESIPNSGWATTARRRRRPHRCRPSSATLLAGSSSAMRLGTSELATPPFAMFTNSCTPKKPTMSAAEPLGPGGHRGGGDRSPSCPSRPGARLPWDRSRGC